MSEDHAPNTARRGFLRTSQALGGYWLLQPQTVFGSQANSAPRIGIVGCGGRGTYVGGLFIEFTGARVAALADPIPAAMDALSTKLQTGAVRRHTGLHGHRDLVRDDIDAVVITSPPYFHPDHVEAALAAGKHVYLAKPVAADVSGCLRIQEAAAKAGGKHSVWVDWQTRMSPSFREAATRVHRGDIGEAVFGMAGFHAGRLPKKEAPGLSATELRLRNWVFDKVLSGDIIVEQNIHSLDVANWFLRARPLRAFGTAGRKARTDVGDCWDHFLVTLWYPNDVRLEFSGAQFLKGGRQIFTRIHGSAGTVIALYGGSVTIEGDTPWTGVKADTTMRYTSENVMLFVDSIRAAKPVNNVSTSVESTLSAILGRMAAEREKIVTWDEMMRSGEKYDARLSL